MSQHSDDEQKTQMAFDSAGDDAVGTSENPADHPEPGPLPDADRPASYEDEAGADFPDEEREVVISDGDAVAGNPASAGPAEPELPDDVGPDAVPPGNAGSNEYDKE